MKTFLKKLFLFVFLSIFLAEVFVRTFLSGYIDKIHTDFNPYRSFVKSKPAFVFMGSSRVAAAIDEDVFSSQDIRILNSGLGHSTVFYHYFSLRNLIEEKKVRFDSIKFFVEAPTGLPEYLKSERDEWVFENQGIHAVRILAPLMNYKDLIQFLIKSKNTLKTKCYLVFYYCFHSFQMLEYINNGVFRTWNLYSPQKQKSKNLTTHGGIRNDDEGIDLIKKMQRKKVNADWHLDFYLKKEESMVLALKELVEEHGGELIFFEMPEASFDKDMKLTKAGYGLLQEWNSFKDENGIKQVYVKAINFNDSSFPDFLHMGKSESIIYSKELYNEIRTSFMQNNKFEADNL
ncbi:MAG: hypothetical protein ACK4ND_11500 [Cytophagaceae bacterium]